MACHINIYFSIGLKSLRDIKIDLSPNLKNKGPSISVESPSVRLQLVVYIGEQFVVTAVCGELLEDLLYVGSLGFESAGVIEAGQYSYLSGLG